MRLFLTLIVLCVSVLADGGDGVPNGGNSKPVDDLSRAADEFKVLTRSQGMRSDSPATAQEHAGPKMLWHGRLYENFRNDFLDAIPHEVRQNGADKSTLRRNQFGFNAGGPLFIPKLTKN
ncbi:MAG: hypothetical protein ACRD5L_12820, partial [Bryobacteraceae bacterium]